MGYSELVESVAIGSSRGKRFKQVLYRFLVLKQMLKEQTRTFPSSIPHTMNVDSRDV